MRSIWFLILLGSLITYHCLTTVAGEDAQPSTDASKAKPTLEQCKGYVDAALKTSSPSGETEEDSGEPPDSTAASEEDPDASTEQDGDSKAEEDASQETQEEDASQEDGATAEKDDEESQEATAEEQSTEEDASAAPDDDATNEESTEADDENKTAEDDSTEGDDATNENADTEEDNTQEEGDTAEDNTQEEGDTAEDNTQEEGNTAEESAEDGDANATQEESGENTAEDSAAADDSGEDGGSKEQDGVEQVSAEDEDSAATKEESGEDGDGAKSDEDDKSTDGDTEEDTGEETKSDDAVSSDVADQADQPDESGESQEQDEATQEDQASAEDAGSPEAEAGVSGEEEASKEGDDSAQADSGEQDASAEEEQATSDSQEGSEEDEEEQEHAEPYEPRPRNHITQILGLDDSEETTTTFNLLDKVTASTLKELKSTYENAIKPLEQLYKYRDLSNRHFGDPEIFSKPLIVFMGPWSGGKSTIINWLLGIQHDDSALRTGADPSPAQFNIMMYGKEPEKLDGTQLAADWTFSGLQKFGQSFLDRLRGQKLPNRLLEKVNIVEIPGILEVRKQVERSFPFNDACQWFIDRADTLFLIYDPAKLDIGPETEAILDQLKGRENQVRIVLNKADTVKPDELLRVQAMLIWNISPLMSSAEPPVMYAASLWDRPLQVESPKALLVAHEQNFLKDIRDGIERRVETRIAAARRFAVRVRNHAKMVDCYLNTFNNHRSFFGDRKKISTDIIDHPQNYHIYEGLSTLNNISRYDLPDPDTYRDFFRINPIWEFPTLQSTCSFWRGCPLHKLDIAIAYELPEILGKFRRQREAILSAKQQGSSRN